MKTNRIKSKPVTGTLSTHRDNRAGTTLGEVLFSILVMSIGVIALATLFPISVIRSVQATQNTHGTNLRYNVEALLDARPELLDGYAEWRPTKRYNVGDRVVPSKDWRRHLARYVFVVRVAGISAAVEPQWTTNATVPDNAVIWEPFELGSYVVDPLAYHMVDNTALRPSFGNDGTNALTFADRLPGWGQFSKTAAEDVAYLPDQWTMEAESTIASAADVTSNTVTLTDLAFPLSDVVTANMMTKGRARVVLFDLDGKRSITAVISAINVASLNSQTITFAKNLYGTNGNPDGGALTSDDQPIRVTRVRVESQQQLFSWMLSVRRGISGSAFVDCVVFYKRSFDSDQEFLHNAIFHRFDVGPNGVPGNVGDDDTANGVDDLGELGGGDDVPCNWVIVRYDPAGKKPFFKRGGFICDVRNLRWYRITKVEENATLPAWESGAVGSDSQFVKLTIEDRIHADSYSAGALPTTTALQRSAVLVQGIVDVYPLGARVPWESK